MSSRGRRVHHHRRVDTVERAALEEVDLPATALLGRRADDMHGQAEIVGERRECETRTGGRRRDHIVPARVADPRQCVVFGADRDVERSASDHARERGG
jgi:hypothetical protein